MITAREDRHQHSCDAGDLETAQPVDERGKREGQQNGESEGEEDVAAEIESGERQEEAAGGEERRRDRRDGLGAAHLPLLSHSIIASSSHRIRLTDLPPSGGSIR